MIQAEGRGETMISFKRAHFERDIILTCMRWYLAYPNMARTSLTSVGS
jgi:transposase-like protein